MKIIPTLGAILTCMTGFSFAIEKPNIVIFYVDDLGWQDVEKLNDLDEPCPFETPNIIKLASNGMNLSHGYSPSPTCAPSRAAILSGIHPAVTQYTHVTAASIPKQLSSNEFQEPFLGSYYDLNHTTLADVLRKNGYATGHYGKWHTGLNASAYGFEFLNQTRGVHSGMGDRTKDFAKANDKKYPLSKKKYPPVSEDFPNGISYPYDEVTDSALNFIKDHNDKPFFLNLCHWMVHWPALTRNGELLEYYCKKMGQPFPPKPGAMTLKGQQNPYFAAMVTTVDWSLGRVVDLLEKTDDPRHPGKKLIDTTYIFFTSDNGGAETKGKEILSDNFPLKYGKKYAEEGGVRVPMVITGPGIKAGTESTQLINQLDFFPSILKLTASKMDEDKKSKLSGLDVTPLLLGETSEVLDAKGKKRESLFWHFPHNMMKAVIRKGDFRLYRQFKTNDYALYRLYKDGKRADLEEKHDLIADPEYSKVKEELIAELNQQLKDSNAELPYRNPKFKGATLPSAKIVSTKFVSATQAKLKLSSKASKAAKAFILYYREEGIDAKKQMRSKDFSGGDPEIGYEVKIPATVSKDGFEITAAVPTGVNRVRFIVIDSNYYCHFSEIITSK